MISILKLSLCWLENKLTNNIKKININQFILHRLGYTIDISQNHKKLPVAKWKIVFISKNNMVLMKLHNVYVPQLKSRSN